MRRVGPYVLLSRIASGTLGDVFLARREMPSTLSGGAESADQEQLAVKVLRPPLARDLRFARLLFTEASTATRFRHPAAIRMIEVSRDAADLFIAMEFAEGQTLSVFLKRLQASGEPIEPRLLFWIGGEVASVLGTAHQTPWFNGAPSGMIHGGISPRSVLVTYEGQVKVLGLGAGRARLAVSPSSARLPYTAPEILLEKEPTSRVDVYSLGVLLYDALTHRHVFRRVTDEETKAAVREGKAPPLNALTLKIDPGVADLVQRMMAPKVESRIAELGEVERLLREASEGAAEELSDALAKRMRAIFGAEIETERRLKAAATRAASTPGARARHSSGVSQPPSQGARPSSQPTNPPMPRSTSKTGTTRAPPSSEPTLPTLHAPPPRVTSQTGRSTSQVGSAPGSGPTLDTLKESPASAERAIESVHSKEDRKIASAAIVSDNVWSEDLGDGQITAPDHKLGFDAAALAARVEDRTPTPRELHAPHDGPEEKTDPGQITSATAEDLKSSAAATPFLEVTTFDLATMPRIARYQTQSVAGRSSNAVFFRGRDPNIARTVIIKAMDPEYISDTRLRRDEWVSLFKREARLAGRLAHPHLPMLYDAGREGGLLFIVYSAVEGRSLHSILERGRALPPARIRRIVMDVASALHHMHEHGVVHGDVRPTNVIVDDHDRATLVDFSMAMEVSGQEHPLLASNVLALSPEYFAGFGYTPQADQFTLGALLYQMLVGTRPFRALDDRELVVAIQSKNPRPPEALDPRMDKDLSEIAMRLLEKDPALRYESCGALVERLERGPENHRIRPEDLLDGSPISLTGHAPLPEEPSEPAVERDTEPRLSLKSVAGSVASGSSLDVVLIDRALDPKSVAEIVATSDAGVVSYRSLDHALDTIRRARPRTVIIARSSVEDLRTAQRQIAHLSPGTELRVVPDAAARLLGPLVDPDDLVRALIALMERTSSLGPSQELEIGGAAPEAARIMARRLSAGRRAELIAPLAVAAKSFAERLRLSITSEEVMPIIPQELAILLGEVERLLTGPEEAAGAHPIAQIVAVADSYFGATRPRDGRQRVSPRRAILDLRETAGKRIRSEVVEALVEHLREIISALALSPVDSGAPRILIADSRDSGALVHALEFDGFSIEHVQDGHAAWERLRREAYRGAIVDRTLPGRDGLALLRLCRAHPDTEQVPFLILSGTPDSALESEVARAGAAEVIERTSEVDAIRVRVGRWMSA